MSEGERQMSDVGCRMSDVGCQRSEGRGQRSEGRFLLLKVLGGLAAWRENGSWEWGTSVNNQITAWFLYPFNCVAKLTPQ
jgi:hypothetical protein